TPKAESFVETPDGVGTVSSVNLLRQQVQVRLEDDPETPHCYHNCEICVIRNGKGKRPEGYVEPPLEELAKLRRQPEEESKAPVSEEASLAAALDAYTTRREEKVPVLESESALQPEEGADGDQGQGSGRSRNRRRRRGRGTGRRNVRRARRNDRVERKRNERPLNKISGN
ncbi:MAG: hypothetical protein IIY07_00300, partial [Thermoguttaceae bacterium]|nr:hypothetical protein [Thermoguttaceae bacterium]